MFCPDNCLSGPVSDLIRASRTVLDILCRGDIDPSTGVDNASPPNKNLMFAIICTCNSSRAARVLRVFSQVFTFVSNRRPEISRAQTAIRSQTSNTSRQPSGLPGH